MHETLMRLAKNKKTLISLLLLAALVAIIFSVIKGFRSGPSRPNVVLILLDTLRADHMGVYGYERDTTPFLDKFGKENILFENAVTPSPWTPPAVSSLFSGKYATTHGHNPPDDRNRAAAGGRKLSQNLLTIAEVLKGQNYQTYGVSPNPWITPMFGFDQGFDQFVFTSRAPASEINSKGKEFLQQALAHQNKPFFLYLHYLDVHTPYKPPEGFENFFTGDLASRHYEKKPQKRINAYDSEIRYLDSEIENLMNTLKSNGVYDNSLIVIVADHGEQFMEHGSFEHGNKLHSEEVHIPFFIKPPGQPRQQKIEATVSIVDIFPTILNYLKIERPAGLQGVSLIDHAELSGREGVFSEISHDFLQRAFISSDGRKVIAAFPTGTKDMVKGFSSASFFYYDRNKDYQENTALEDIEHADELKKNLEVMLSEVVNARVEAKSEEVSVDDKTIKQLESLGYLK